MEIFLDKRAVKTIRLSIAEAIEEDDMEALREDILESFTEDQVEAIEQRLGGGDFFEFLGDLLDEWSADDADELFDLLETQLSDVGIELKYPSSREAAEEEDEEDEADDEEEEDEEDEEEDDDLDLDDYEDEAGDDED